MYPQFSSMIEIAGGILLAVGAIVIGIPLLLLALMAVMALIGVPISAIMALEEAGKKSEAREKERSEAFICLTRHEQHLWRLNRRRWHGFLWIAYTVVILLLVRLNTTHPGAIRFFTLLPCTGVAYLGLVAFDGWLNAAPPQQQSRFNWKYHLQAGMLVAVAVAAGILDYLNGEGRRLVKLRSFACHWLPDSSSANLPKSNRVSGFSVARSNVSRLLTLQALLPGLRASQPRLPSKKIGLSPQADSAAAELSGLPSIRSAQQPVWASLSTCKLETPRSSMGMAIDA